jgi:hypothetical protein
MKYNLIEIIANKSVCLISDEYLLSVEQIYDRKKENVGKIFCINDINVSDAIKINKPNFYTSELIDDELFYPEWDGEVFTINLESLEQKKILNGEYLGIIGRWKSNIIFKNHTINTKSNYKIFDKDFIVMINSDTYETIWTSEKLFSYNFLSDEKNLYVVDSNYCVIRSLDANTGIDQWQFSVKEIGKYFGEYEYEGIQDGLIDRLITIYQDSLIVQITLNRLICLDTQTGTLSWIVNNYRDFLPFETPEYVKLYFEGTGRGQESNWHLLRQTNKMYLCWWAYILEFNLDTQECVTLYDGLLEKMSTGVSQLVGNLLYSIANNGNEVRIFDVFERQFIWRYKFPEETRLNGIQVHKDKIYLRDWNDNLLILEREE